MVAQNGFAVENKDIFKTLSLAFLNTQKENNNSDEDKIRVLADNLPVSSIEKLQSSDLTPKQAMASIYSGLIVEARNDKDKQQANDLMAAWKEVYETQFGEKINF